MLDAAVVGEVFTSPTPVQIRNAILSTAGTSGALLIVKNYSGDVMNFEMAGEMLEQTNSDIPIATVCVSDDTAQASSAETPSRRGIGLTVLLEKILGAAAEAGYSLPELLELAQRICANGRSIGVALTGATHPSAGHPTFTLAADEMELGVGIHGEPGIVTLPFTHAAAVSEKLVNMITAELPLRGREVIAMLSGLGSTPLSELYIGYADVVRELLARQTVVVRSLVGNFVTSSDMAGCALTLLAVDEEMLQLWDAPVCTAALRWKA